MKQDGMNTGRETMAKKQKKVSESSEIYMVKPTCAIPILLFGLLLMSRQAAKDERPPPPDFKEFMLPLCRTITFGTLGELNRVPGARYAEHNLSGWFGRSGSMICAVRKPGTVVVFGICKSIIARVLSSSLP
jgi:hypothetical protein